MFYSGCAMEGERYTHRGGEREGPVWLYSSSVEQQTASHRKKHTHSSPWTTFALNLLWSIGDFNYQIIKNRQQLKEPALTVVHSWSMSSRGRKKSTGGPLLARLFLN